jgi:excisionase family DNA binding protein
MGRSDTERELLSVNQAARQLGLAPRRLRTAIRTGELRAIRPGSRTCYVIWPDVLRWLREQRVAPCDHARTRVAEIMKRSQGTRPHFGVSDDG